MTDKETPMKFCKDCKWFTQHVVAEMSIEICTHPTVVSNVIPDLVMGTRSEVHCWSERHEGKLCGLGANLWEAGG